MSNYQRNKCFNLIIPIGSDKPEYKHLIPFEFTPDKDGVLFCIKAIKGLNFEIFDNIYFTILRKHAELYGVDKMLEIQLTRINLKNARIVILDNPTRNQSETIFQTIQSENIKGALFIKDADGYFETQVDIENCVATYPLESLSIVDPRHKSYVAIDDLEHITNIIEKRVISNLFNAGGYGFEDAKIFINIYKKFAEYSDICLSHLIYALLLEGQTFRPLNVTNYVDWNLRFLK